MPKQALSCKCNVFWELSGRNEVIIMLYFFKEIKALNFSSYSAGMLMTVLIKLLKPMSIQ
jgi:hypothetical protein